MDTGNWFEYKTNVINLDKIEGFRVHKARKEDVQYTGIDTHNGKRLWILHAGYTALDSFATKDEAMRVVRDILAGKHKVRLPK